EAGAKEVHVRISSPEIKNPCLYGIDMLTKKELIAANHTKEEIAEIIGADSIEFLSVEGMEEAIIKDRTINQAICAACMTGNYPVLENVDGHAFYHKYYKERVIIRRNNI